MYNNPSDNPQIPPVNFNNQIGYQVVPIYIPNEGYRYFVIVPVDKWNFLNSNHIEGDNKLQEQKYDKYNGKYNAKLKKYKAYEKFIKPQVRANYFTFQTTMILNSSLMNASYHRDFRFFSKSYRGLVLILKFFNNINSS